MTDNVLFVRSDEDSCDNSDPWDDTLLIRAYETAFEGVQKTLKKEKSQVRAGPSRKWKKGDFCRANYSDDGVAYEAVIKDISSDSCIVQYCGYGNEEQILLSDLQPSKGKAARDQQIQFADSTRVEWQECVDSSSEAESSYVPVKTTRRKRTAKEEIHMPPPPPPPPDFFAKTGKTPDKNQALHSMLMSWYMSGYHTGYYEALKNTQNK